MIETRRARPLVCATLGALAAAVGAAAASGWQELRPEGGRFRIEMPGEAVVERETRSTPVGPAVETRYVLHQGAGELAAETHDIPPFASFMPAAVILDQAAQGVLEAKGGTALRVLEIEMQGAPAREIHYRVPKDPPLIGLSRAVLVGSRIFLLHAITPREPAEDPEITRFLASFRFFADSDETPGS